MTSPRGPRAGRASLSMERLEDRLTPAALDPRVTAPAPIPVVNTGGIEVASDRVLVTMNDGAGTGGLAASAVTQEVRALGFGIYSVRLKPGITPGAAVAALGTVPGVAAAELDPIMRASVVPNDASYPGLFGTQKIGAETVWNTFTGSSSFVVGVIDSGIDYTHPDLAANIWTNPGEIAGNGIDDDNNGYIDDIHGWDFINDDSDPMDDNDHGTHVAGTIGAVGNNGVGVAGVNWNVKLMALKFLGANNNGPVSAAIEATNYAVMMGVQVTNNSWGGNGLTQALGRAIGRAQAAGQIFVAAAGNGGFDGIGDNNDAQNMQPTNYSTRFNNVISVAAVDDTDTLADFSNFGVNSVTLAAPGVGILSTTPGNTYQVFGGTSMASPHVAGAIALYWSANPTLTYDQVINKLKTSVDPIPGLAGKVSTGGRLNVAKMFDAYTVPPIVVGAPVGTDAVRVLAPGGATQQVLTPYPGFLGGIVAAAGDLTGDGVADTVTAATLGGHVKVFDGKTGTELRSFFGFEGYRGPINLAIGDLNNDGVGDIVLAANLNGHVKVFDGKTGELTFSSLVYSGYTGAIAVASADTDGDGRNELLTAAQGGKGVHVKAFAAGTQALRDSFLATGAGSWSNFSLAAADMDYDGIAELLVSQGPQVRVLDARTKAVRADFLAFDPNSQDRITVQGARFTGDPTAEIIVVDENQGRSHVKVFAGLNYTLTDSFLAGSR